jgi:hypothetical protein
MEDCSKGIADLRDRFVALEQKMERRFEAIDRRFDQLDRRFMWVIGMQFSTLLTIIPLLLRR